jgi:hypothetical protein
VQASTRGDPGSPPLALVGATPKECSWQRDVHVDSTRHARRADTRVERNEPSSPRGRGKHTSFGGPPRTPIDRSATRPMEMLDDTRLLDSLARSGETGMRRPATDKDLARVTVGERGGGGNQRDHVATVDLHASAGTEGDEEPETDARRRTRGCSPRRSQCWYMCAGELRGGARAKGHHDEVSQRGKTAMRYVERRPLQPPFAQAYTRARSMRGTTQRATRGESYVPASEP